MWYPTREYQRDSPSDLLLRRPQGIKPKKKIVKIRDSGLTRKVISASTEHRIDGYLLVSATFHDRSSSTRLEGHSGSNSGHPGHTSRCGLFLLFSARRQHFY